MIRREPLPGGKAIESVAVATDDFSSYETLTRLTGSSNGSVYDCLRWPAATKWKERSQW